MANYKVIIFQPPGAPVNPLEYAVNANFYEEDTSNHTLHFVKGQDNKKVASFRTWDAVLKVNDEEQPPT